MKRKYCWKITDRSNGNLIIESENPFICYDDAKENLFKAYLNLVIDDKILCNYTIYETDDSIGVNDFSEN